MVAEVATEVMAPLPAALSGWRECYVDLHRNPELSGQEVRTAGIVAGHLLSSGYEVATGIGGHGVVGVLRNGDGPIVALRADMDALPVREQTGLPYASQVVARDSSGHDVAVMHACGHDAHTACLLGTAELLATARDAWVGTLMCIAQPAEETMAGARSMLRDGLYERFVTPDIVLGQHVGPFPTGRVFHRAGPLMAAAMSLDVTIFGRGGHGSRPDATIDPVVVGAFIVTRLQTIVAREVEPMQPAVVTVGKFHAGTKSNVIPDEAHLALNIRSFDDRVQRHVLDAIERIIRAECDAAGCPQPPLISQSYGAPTTRNDGAVIDRVRAAHVAWFGPERVREMPEPAMATEDFGLFAHPDGDPDSPPMIPTGFWFWGGASPQQFDAVPGRTAREKLAAIPNNHHPAFMIDPDPTLQTGVEALTVAALAYLDG
jgi:hippurate hydrolase